MGATGQTCVNIGPKAIRLRRRAGFVFALLSVALLALLGVLAAPRAARLLLFAPLFGAALGLLQARENT